MDPSLRMGAAREMAGFEPSWKLPRGRHNIPREVTEQHQRDRLIAAVATTMTEQGYAKLTVEHVIREAGVSRTTFYEIFENKDDAVLVAHTAIFERFLGILFRACGAESEWPLQIRSAIRAALEFAAAEPGQATLLTLDALAANIEIARHVMASADHLAALLSRGRTVNEEAVELPELTEKSVIGAISAIVSSRIANGEADGLPALAPQIVEFTLTPYIGAPEARRIAMAAA